MHFYKLVGLHKNRQPSLGKNTVCNQGGGARRSAGGYRIRPYGMKRERLAIKMGLGARRLVDSRGRLSLQVGANILHQFHLRCEPFVTGRRGCRPSTGWIKFVCILHGGETFASRTRREERDALQFPCRIIRENDFHQPHLNALPHNKNRHPCGWRCSLTNCISWYTLPIRPRW